MTSPEASTRTAIVDAFNRLVLSSRRARPPIAQLLREAGVARSTLYKHFDDRESLLLEAMRTPLSIIADATMGDAPPRALIALLEHFWDHRKNGDEVFNGTFAARLTRALAENLQKRAPELGRNDALRLADTLLGFLRLWTLGETPEPAAVLAARMIASARAQRNAFRERAD